MPRPSDRVLGRSAKARGSMPTELGCPECAGVLHAFEEGPKRRLRLECRVGHSFSLDDVLEAKEALLERSLWSALALLGEIVSSRRERISRLARSPALVRRASEKRIAQAAVHIAALRKIISEMSPPAEPEGKCR